MSIVKSLREKVPQALCDESDRQSSVSMGRVDPVAGELADAAILAILEELSRINLHDGLCDPTLVEADEAKYRAISRSLLELVQNEIAQ